MEAVLAVLEIQFALKNEGAEFLGVRTIEWIRFLEFGFGGRWMCLDNSIISCNESDHICIFRSYRRGLVGCFIRSVIGTGMVSGFDMYVSRLHVCDFRLCRLVCG